MPPSSLITTFFTMIVPATSSFVIVHVWVAPFATLTFEQLSYVVVYPAIGVSASTTECEPAATVSVFLPCNASASCKNAVDDPPSTLNEKFVATFVPPLSLITTFFTINVPG